MAEWIDCKIADLGTVIGGATPSTKRLEYYENGSIAWITPKDLSTFRGRYIRCGERNITEIGLKSCSTQLLPKNTVLFSSRAPIGYIAIAENELCTNQGFKSVIPNENTDPLFLYYLLKYNKNKIESMGSGTTFKEVSGNTLKNIVVSVPRDKKVQEQISSILGAIDDKIEANEKINNNLAKQAKTIYQAWFEKFILSNGSCPPTWKRGILADIANITSGKRPPNKSDKKMKGFEIPLVGATSIVGFTNKANYINKILVIGRVGTHGVIQRINSPCWTSDNTLVMTSNLYEYTYQVLQKIDYRAINRGSTQPLITQADMNKVDILIPDNQTLHEFELIVGQLMQMYETNLIENTKLAELRDYLLPRLISGELDISKVNI